MNQPFFAGVDVGGTNTKVGLLSDSGEVLVSGKFPTEPKRAPEHCLENATRLIRQMTQESGLSFDELLAVGLATPGPMDIPNGLVLTPFNLPGWRHANVRDTLAELTDRPVAFSNDAGAAAFGEYWIGSGKQYESIVLITLGTGVGGGIIINDFSIDGAHSHGAEIGHMIVDASEDALVCACGGKGHLEAYASATGIVARCAAAMARGAKSSLTATISDDNPLTALGIYLAAEKGDELANDLITQTANYLGDAIVSLVHIIDPDAFLLGGAVNFGGQKSEIGRSFLKQIGDHAKPNCLPLLAEKLTIEFANLGSDAGFIGAAGLGRQLYLSKSNSISPIV